MGTPAGVPSARNARPKSSTRYLTGISEVHRNMSRHCRNENGRTGIHRRVTRGCSVEKHRRTLAEFGFVQELLCNSPCAARILSAFRSFGSCSATSRSWRAWTLNSLRASSFRTGCATPMRCASPRKTWDCAGGGTQVAGRSRDAGSTIHETPSHLRDGCDGAIPFDGGMRPTVTVRTTYGARPIRGAMPLLMSRRRST